MGYRDQWDFDVQHGICPICGPPYRNGPGRDCPGCNPPVRTYTYQCGTHHTTDDDDYGCPEHGQTCRRVKTEIHREPER